MTKNYKVSRGMTLIEVIVAMTIFAIMASAITGVMLRANKMSNRAKMRDTQLATQTNIIGRNKSSTRDELQVVNPNEGYTGDYKIVFNEGGTLKAVDNVKVYETNEGRFDSEFGFQLKTVIPSSSLNGLPLTNLGEDEYCMRYVNDLSESVTITIEITDGYLFEGNGQKYVHTTRSYVKTIPGGTTADVGFCYDGDSDISIKIETGISGTPIQGLTAMINCPTTSMDPDVRKIIFNIVSAGGTNPTFHVDMEFPDA